MQEVKGIQDEAIVAGDSISTYEKRSCPTCGKELPPAKGKGRPMERHPECRKLEQLLSWSEDLLMQIDFEPEKAGKVRSHYWYLGNLVKAKGQKGVK